MSAPDPSSLPALRAGFEPLLEGLLTRLPLDQRLIAAMKHGTLIGGKRVRPSLVMETAYSLKGCDESVLKAAAAIELIHAFSLIHDDLPAMDDDDLRRGKPTVHKAFDEASAILAGDGLNTLAFLVLSGEETGALDLATRLRLIETLSRATLSMISGQMRDLAAEGRFETRRTAPDLATIETIQREKTGALIEAAVTMGAVLGGATPATQAAFAAYARALGLAFQISDDLLDLRSSAEEAGKKTGKDAAAGKGTFVDLLGEVGAQHRLEAEISAGLAALATIDADTGYHEALIRAMAGRRS